MILPPGWPKLVGIELAEPATAGGLTADDPPLWRVRVRVEVNGQEAAAWYEFTAEQPARDLITIAETAPDTVAVMAADLITHSPARAARGLRIVDERYWRGR